MNMMKFILTPLLLVSVICQADEKPSYAGAWLSKNYYESIKKFKSPRKAQGGSQYIIIPDEPVSSAMMIYNFHEGATVLLDSVKRISENEIKINKIEFIKIAPNAHQNYQRPNIVESILFNGKYSNKNGAIVNFNKDGTLSGLGDFKYYYVQLDYYDAGLDVDLLILGRSPSDINVPPIQYSKWFGFDFNDKYLNIYKIKCKEHYENDCVVIANGELVYKLERINDK